MPKLKPHDRSLVEGLEAYLDECGPPDLYGFWANPPDPDSEELDWKRYRTGTDQGPDVVEDRFDDENDPYEGGYHHSYSHGPDPIFPPEWDEWGNLDPLPFVPDPAEFDDVPTVVPTGD